MNMSAPFCTKLGEKVIDVVSRDDEDEWQTMDIVVMHGIREYEQYRFSFLCKDNNSWYFNDGIIKLYAAVIKYV